MTENIQKLINGLASIRRSQVESGWMNTDDLELLAQAEEALIEVAKKPEEIWEYSYVENYVDDLGVFQREHFSDYQSAKLCLDNEAYNVEQWNILYPDEGLKGSIERRKYYEPGEWEAVL